MFFGRRPPHFTPLVHSSVSRNEEPPLPPNTTKPVLKGPFLVLMSLKYTLCSPPCPLTLLLLFLPDYPLLPLHPSSSHLPLPPPPPCNSSPFPHHVPVHLQQVHLPIGKSPSLPIPGAQGFYLFPGVCPQGRGSGGPLTLLITPPHGCLHTCPHTLMLWISHRLSDPLWMQKDGWCSHSQGWKGCLT